VKAVQIEPETMDEWICETDEF